MNGKAIVVGIGIGLVGALLLSWWKPLIPADEFSIKLLASTVLLGYVVSIPINMILTEYALSMAKQHRFSLTGIGVEIDNLFLKLQAHDLVNKLLKSRTLGTIAGILGFFCGIVAGTTTAGLIGGVIGLVIGYAVGSKDVGLGGFWAAIAVSIALGTGLGYFMGDKVIVPALIPGIVLAVVLMFDVIRPAPAIHRYLNPNFDMGSIGIIASVIAFVVMFGAARYI